MRWVRGIVLVLVCVTTVAIAQDKPSNPELPKEATTDWWGTVQRNIAQSEYNISKAKRPLPEAKQALQAPNRKQNFRTWFMDNGFTIQPRDTEEVEWSFGLALIGYGPEGKVHPVHPAEPEAETNRVRYPHDEIIQWCENREDGLEHGFTVKYPVDGDTLEVRMAITGDLTPSLANELTLELFNEHGVRVLTYDKLLVTDAAGKELSARFQLKDRALSIITDVQDAVYPIEIDPLATTPAWTA